MDGKVIALTGAASGIGLSTARLLASQGALLSLADNNSEVLGKAIARIVEAWFASTVERYGRLDGCADIAGVTGRCQGTQRVWEVTDDEYDFIMDVTVRGTLNCLRAQIPHLREGAAIANASSICGLIGLPLCGVYAASKHAVSGMTKAAAKELGPMKIRVNCFNPGFIETPMLQSSSSLENMDKTVTHDNIALRGMGIPDEVAKVVLWLLSDASEYVTGASISVMIDLCTLHLDALEAEL
ncbi:3-oxoacyl-reductase [Sarocladium strictum]